MPYSSSTSPSWDPRGLSLWRYVYIADEDDSEEPWPDLSPYKSVAGHAISVKGANASIEGNFTVASSRFVLWTSHAPIIASVNMGSGGAVWDFDMARLFTNDAYVIYINA